MQTFLNTLAALIVALPLGYVSDQVDRRKILAMILAGMLAALLWTILVATQTGLSLRLIWLTSVFTLFGGGNYAAEMIMGVMIVDTCSARDRTKTLYYMYSCFIFVEIVAPPIAYGTAKLSLWIPFAIGIMCLVLDCGVLIIMPDVSKKDPSRGETPMRIDPDPPAANSNTENDEETKQSYVQQLYEVVRLFKQRNMLLSLPIFLIGSFRAISLRAVLQYASSRFEWDFSDTNALVTEVASINLALFCFILPSLITLINNHYHPHLQLLNLSIVQGSLVVLGSGALLLSLAPSSTSMIIGKICSSSAAHPPSSPSSRKPQHTLYDLTANVISLLSSTRLLRHGLRRPRHYALARDILVR